MQLQPGTLVLNGRFRIERLLGAGGSGEVYLATRTSRLSGQVALKILRRGETGVDTAKIESYRARFELEGRLQDELGTSPGIVRVIDDGDHDGSPVLVMDYMSGGTLKAEIVAAAGKGLPWQRCADVLREAATGLQALHARGYVHRDVKPSNILLDAHGQAKIADLGVVQTELTRTRTDGVSFDHPCSPGYCSPEHAVGTAALSPAADVYALGVIGFEMLTGHLPQPSVLDQPVEPIAGDAPDWYKALITRMLAYDYRERPKTGEAVALAIRDAMQYEREGAARRVARMAELSRKIDAVLAKQPHTKTELDEADRLLDELRNLAPAHPSTVDFTIRLARTMRETPVVPPQPPPEPYKRLTRQERLRQEAELREDLEPAQHEKRWADVVRISEALLDLVPDDPDGTAALRAATREGVRRDREIARVRAILANLLAARAWDQVDAGAQALLALVPGDAEALQAQADLAAELERRRVAAARQKAEDEARGTLRKAMASRAWDSMADAALAVLAFVPGDGEALKAQADLRAERERVAAHARAVTAARGALRTALAARDWKNVADWAVELLALAPDDAEALQAQAEHQAELERRRIAAEKKRAEDAAREALRRVVRAQDWDQVERYGAALIALLPNDREALQARADLAAVLERRRVAAERKKAEDEARAGLRQVMNERAWDHVEGAALALLELVPGDGEALKAQADLRAECERVAAHVKTVADARGVLATALAAREWESGADLAGELLALAPDDPEANQALFMCMAELESRRKVTERQRAEEIARIELRKVIGDQADKFNLFRTRLVTRAAETLLALAPEDPEALRALSSLTAKTEFRLIPTGRRQAEVAARTAMQKMVVDQDWARVADAARAILAREPQDADALKAAADARAHLDFRSGLRRVSADRMVLALALGVEMEFVRVPGGPFLMGSNKPASGTMQRIKRALLSESPKIFEDPMAEDDELPLHRVTLPEYWIGKTPVTVAQFAVFARAANYKTQAEKDGKSYGWTGSTWGSVAGADWAHPSGPDTNVAQKQIHPVIHMSWDDGIAFCEWASKLVSSEVALPSEAEWEKAARGTEGYIYPWGNDRPDDTRLNFAMNFKDTTPIGKYGARGQGPFGCDDMAGNVWEWTRSLKKPYPYEPKDGREYLPSRDRRVLRGGSFYGFAQLVRCASRSGFDPSDHSEDLGFRVILRPPSL